MMKALIPNPENRAAITLIGPRNTSGITNANLGGDGKMRFVA
jgi:hypothetical protein